MEARAGAEGVQGVRVRRSMVLGAPPTYDSKHAGALVVDQQTGVLLPDFAAKNDSTEVGGQQVTAGERPEGEDLKRKEAHEVEFTIK